MRVHRLIAILMMIEKKGKVKANVLASQLEVSTRTIYRDIETLCEAGFPLYARTGPDGGISYMDGYTLGIDSESQNVEMLLPSLINHLPSIPDRATTASSIEAGFHQLQSLLQGDHSSTSPLSDKLLIDHDTWWGGTTDPFDIRQLIDALWSLNQIEINYQKANGSTTERRIDPYGLILKHTNWYLVAYCHKAKAMRTFRCERITNSRITKDQYQIPRTFNLKSHWENSVKAFSDATSLNEEYLVTFEIPAIFADQFTDKEIVWNAKKGDCYLGTLNMRSYAFAKADILDIVAYVKILAPEELVTYACNILQNQLSKYT